MLYSINFKSYIYNGFSQNISCGGHAVIQVSVLFYIKFVGLYSSSLDVVLSIRSCFMSNLDSFECLISEGLPVQVVFSWSVRLSSGSSCRCCLVNLVQFFIQWRVPVQSFSSVDDQGIGWSSCSSIYIFV